jgi:magnesium transporter
MSKKRHQNRDKDQVGTIHFRPGSHAGESLVEEGVGSTKITVTAYDASAVHEEVVQDPAKLLTIIQQWPRIWIRIEGLSEPDKIRAIGKIFDFHHLALEDVLESQLRAKMERYDNTFFLVAHFLAYDENRFSAKQLSMFFGTNFFVSFENERIDALDTMHDRIKRNVANIRSQTADYLVYVTLDMLVDRIFPILDRFSDKLEQLEETVVDDPSRQTMTAIHATKRELLVLRREIWPLREAVNALIRDGGDALSPETKIHLRDCYDEIVRLLDFSETYRELGSDLMDVYLSSVSNRLNEVMKVLTILTTIFAPPTLIAGIYGMNFNNHISPYNMPEYDWYYGYPYAIILMVCTSLSIVLLLWSMGWLGALPPWMRGKSKT